MSGKSKIEWTDTTWNPVTGCSHVSEGCRNCYAARMSHRFSSSNPRFAGTTKRTKQGVRFTGKVHCHEDRLSIPLHWRKREPRRVFVNSMSDLFHEAVPFEFIDQVFAVMALCPQHTFQILTKRPERMAEYLGGRVGKRIYRDCVSRWLDEGDRGFLGKHWDAAHAIASWRATGVTVAHTTWNMPLANVWLGTSVEDQETAGERIPDLFQCPAAVRFLSCEPLLGEMDLCELHTCDGIVDCLNGTVGTACMADSYQRVDWVIVGGESGPGARPMNPDWARSIRDQCKAADVPFFFKRMSKKGPIPDDLMIREYPESVIAEVTP